jgi:hypothetical protein
MINQLKRKKSNLAHKVRISKSSKRANKSNNHQCNNNSISNNNNNIRRDNIIKTNSNFIFVCLN